MNPIWAFLIFIKHVTHIRNLLVEVSIAVKFFTETGLLALYSNPNLGEFPF
jgi:hypothetical protein